MDTEFITGIYAVQNEITTDTTTTGTTDTTTTGDVSMFMVIGIAVIFGAVVVVVIIVAVRRGIVKQPTASP